MFELAPFSSDEPINLDENVIGELGDFWRWSYSAVYTPITRGFLAEYLVFKSVADNADDKFRLPLNYLSTKMEKDEPDIITFYNDEKMTIQVKSIDSITKRLRFKFKKTHKYLPKIDRDNGPKKHNCDVFVFCFLHLDQRQHDFIHNLRKSWNESDFNTQTEVDIQRYKYRQNMLNKSVLNMNNWDFYICPTSLFEKQESVNISKLESLVARNKVFKSGYSNLWQHLRNLNSSQVTR
jgi:hypothetical protein